MVPRSVDANIAHRALCLFASLSYGEGSIRSSLGAIAGPPRQAHKLKPCTEDRLIWLIDVRAALGRLDDGAQRILQLTYTHGLSSTEAARIIGTSPRTYMRLLDGALDELGASDALNC